MGLSDGKSVGGTAGEHWSSGDGDATSDGTSDSIVDFVGSRGEGRVVRFTSPVQGLASGRAMPGAHPLFTSLETFLPSPQVIRRQASPLNRAYPNSQPAPRKITIFSPLAFACSDVDCFQIREVPPVCFVLRKGVPLSGIDPDAIYAQLTVSSHVDFVQDPYPKNSRSTGHRQRYHVPCLPPFLDLRTHH